MRVLLRGLLTLIVVLAVAFAIPTAGADEAPITGTVKAVDTANRTLTVETAAKGKTRQVVIDVKPATTIVRFARGADGRGFSEQAATLEDIRPGWTVAVKTHHQGDREVAEQVRVVHER